MARIMTFNIHWGVGTDGIYSLQRTASVILAEAVDVVALQEVHDGTSKFPESQHVVLSELCGLPHHVLFPTMRGYPEEQDGVGRYGNAILSRFPL